MTIDNDMYPIYDRYELAINLLKAKIYSFKQVKKILNDLNLDSSELTFQPSNSDEDMIDYGESLWIYYRESLPIGFWEVLRNYFSQGYSKYSISYTENEKEKRVWLTPERVSEDIQFIFSCMKKNRFCLKVII